MFFEPDNINNNPGKGWHVRTGATREFIIYSLLESIDFVRTFPPCQLSLDSMQEHEQYPYDEDSDEMDELKNLQALDEFLATNLTDLRTYIVGVAVCYFYFVIGQTSTGDWAGIISKSVST